MLSVVFEIFNISQSEPNPIQVRNASGPRLDIHVYKVLIPVGKILHVSVYVILIFLSLVEVIGR